MSDLTQEIERGVGDFAGSDDNNNNDQRQGGESMRNEDRAPTEQSSGAGAGAGGMESTADNYINKGAYGGVIAFWWQGLMVKGVAVDAVASEEGVPGMADGMINKDVDAEVNKFL